MPSETPARRHVPRKMPATRLTGFPSPGLAATRPAGRVRSLALGPAYVRPSQARRAVRAGQRMVDWVHEASWRAGITAVPAPAPLGTAVLGSA